MFACQSPPTEPRQAKRARPRFSPSSSASKRSLPRPPSRKPGLPLESTSRRSRLASISACSGSATMPTTKAAKRRSAARISRRPSWRGTVDSGRRRNGACACTVIFCCPVPEETVTFPSKIGCISRASGCQAWSSYSPASTAATFHTARCVAATEVLSVHDKDVRTHRVVDVAAERDHARAIELHRRIGAALIQRQLELPGRGERVHLVAHAVAVWKGDRGVQRHDQDVRHELALLLVHDRLDRSGWRPIGLCGPKGEHRAGYRLSIHGEQLQFQRRGAGRS